jgi:hypothetical protein
MKEGRFHTENTKVHRVPLRYGGLHDEAAQAVLQAKDIEIHKESYPIGTQSEVREQLGLVHRAQSLDRLDLQDQFVRNHDVRTEPGFEEHSTVNDRHRNLTSEFKCGFRQFEVKAFLIDRLEQPGTELPVHGNSQLNDTFGQCIAAQHNVSLWLSVVLGVLCVEP